MKKIVLFVITIVSIFSCTQKKEDDGNLIKYNKNLVVTKQFIEAFSTKDSTKEASLLSEDLLAYGPGIGQDSITKDAFIKGDIDHMMTFSDIKLTNAKYLPGLDDNYKITPDVRVYGTWVQKFTKSGKISKMKWHAEFKINEEGKIFGYSEWCELADMSKELDK
jgi:hypothetical protein